MKCYKVVVKTHIPELYKSATVSGLYSINYELNKISKPVDGTLGIFVFKNYNHAKDFAFDNWNIHTRILECEGKKLRPLNMRSQLSYDSIRQFWEVVLLNKKRHKKLFNNIKNAYICPTGTYICSELTPLKVVCSLT